MLMSDFMVEYVKRFEADGGDPKICKGVLWANKQCEKNSEITVIDCLNLVKYTESGWVLSSLHYNWNILSEDERLQFIDALVETGS